MSEVLAKIRKRQRFPVLLPSGDTIEIRTMTIGEHFRMDQLQGPSKVGFFVGCLLLNDDGSNRWEKDKEETDEQFSVRAGRECDLSVPEMAVVKDTHKTLEDIPKQSVLVKNSEETSTPG